MDRRTFLRRSLTAAGAIALVGPEQLARAAGAVYSVPSSIAADGSRDVTAKLLSFIASVPDRSTIVFARGGRYRIDGSVEVRRRSGLVFEGNGCTFLGPVGNNRPHWVFSDGAGMTLRNCTIHGANPHGGVDSALPVRGWGYQHGISARGVSGLTVDNVSVSDVYGDLFFAGYGSSGRPSQQVRLTNSRCARSGRNGITLNNTRDVLIQGCSIGETRRNTFNIEPVDPYFNDGVQIVGNAIGDRRSGFNFLSATRGVNSNFLLKDNVLSIRDLRMEVHPPAGKRNTGWVLSGNRAPNVLTPSWLLQLRNTDTVEITTTENPFDPRRQTTFVVLSGCRGVTVHDNIVRGVDNVLIADSASRNYSTSNNKT